MPLAIVFFACRDDITAPSQRPARPDAPSFAAAVPGITPQVSAGGLHTCALSNDAIVHCWGYNEYGQTTVPTDLGTVSELSTGNYHTCALATGGTATCWGYNAFGQTTIPTGLGSVRQISAAFYNTCALRIDGTVT